MAADPDATERVAVVVPCYNDAATLPETLASLEQQERHELVVVDDGSDQLETVAVLDDLAAGGVQVIRQPNSGPSAARMAGVAATRARYVLPLDADDVLTPGALTVMADALDADPEAAAAWGDTEVFGRMSARARKARVLDPWAITHVNEIPARALIRRDALVEAGGWQLGSGYEDWDLWLAFAERGWRGIHVGRVTSRYRLHGSRRWATDFAQHEDAVARLRDRHPELFARRRANWRRSKAPWRLKLLLPLIASLPLSSAMRSRLSNAATDPRLVLRLRVARARKGAG